MKWDMTNMKTQKNRSRQRQEQAKYFEYETQKRLLSLMNLSPEEYQKRLRKLADEYEI